MVSLPSSPSKKAKQQVLAARCPRTRVSNAAAAEMGAEALAGVKKLIRKERNERYRLKNKQQLLWKKLSARLREKQKRKFLQQMNFICGAGSVLRGFGGTTGFDMAVVSAKVRAMA